MPRPGMMLYEYAGGDYSQASGQFIRLFGGGDPEYQITRDGVEHVLSCLWVDGKPYDERYGIEVNESNLEATVSHVMENLTYGEISVSFRSEHPMRAVFVSEGKNPEVTPLIPPNPHPHPLTRPINLSRWVRFWGMFGFFRAERADHEEKMAAYLREQQELEAYDRNEGSMEAYACRMERKERDAGQRATQETQGVNEEEGASDDVPEEGGFHMKTIKNIMFTLFCGTFMAAAPLIAEAASDSITSISIAVSETKQEAGVVWEAEPLVYSDDYYISEYEWSTAYDWWEPGKKVTLKVTLESEDRSFKKDASVYVTGGEKASASRNSSKEFSVKINYIPKVILEAPTGIYYEDEYTLVWDKVDYAGGYEVQIYRDGYSYKKASVEGRSNTSFDVSDYATDDYLITVAIRAVPSSSKSSYISASEWVMFDEESVSGSSDSTILGSFYGSETSKQFKTDDDAYASGWQFINGYWYYFDPANYNSAAVGWTTIGDHTYKFDAEGKMLTGWIIDGNYWYYLNIDSTGASQPYGSVVYGWVHPGPNSPWFYLNDGSVEGIPAGAMLLNTTTPDGYYVNENGEYNG